MSSIRISRGVKAPRAAVYQALAKSSARTPDIHRSGLRPLIRRSKVPKKFRDRILEAARYITVKQLGTTDDCGFSPFCDDTSTTQEKAFAKIRSRVKGTALAEDILNGR
jgi:hypothetical protein